MNIQVLSKLAWSFSRSFTLLISSLKFSWPDDSRVLAESNYRLSTIICTSFSRTKELKQRHCPPLNSSLAQKCTLVHAPGKNTAGLKFRTFA